MSLISIMLFGMGAPLLALLQTSQENCSMTCCTVEWQSSDSAQQQNGQSSPSGCPMDTSCMPAPLPESLQLQADLPAKKTQLNFFLLVHDLGNDAADMDTGESGQYLTLTPSHFLSQRDILTRHSVLII